MALNLNCALIIVFVLRRSLTFVRNTLIGRYLPIDDSITLHKFTGRVIFFWSVLHTVMHLANIGELRNLTLKTTLCQANCRVLLLWYFIVHFFISLFYSIQGYVIHTTDTEWTLWEYLFTTKPGIGWIPPGLGYITGDILIVVLTIIVICSLSAVRASGYFQVKCILNLFTSILQLALIICHSTAAHFIV